MRLQIAMLAVIPSLLVAQAQPVPVTTAKPGWKWSMDSVRTVVNAVRAGRTLLPTIWPGGARVAVLLSFDVDNETVALRFGSRPSAHSHQRSMARGRVWAASSGCLMHNGFLRASSSRP